MAQSPAQVIAQGTPRVEAHAASPVASVAPPLSQHVEPPVAPPEIEPEPLIELVAEPEAMELIEATAPAVRAGIASASKSGGESFDARY
jgi:hypothetical protein